MPQSAISPFLKQLPTHLQQPTSIFWEEQLDTTLKKFFLLPANKDFLASFVKVCTCSDFIKNALRTHPKMFNELLASGDLQQSYQAQYYVEKTTALMEIINNESELILQLRALRLREMVRIAWRDLAGWTDLHETMKNLSALADAIIDNTLKVLHRWQCNTLGTPFNEADVEQQLFVIAVGKLGGQELNFSSDVDLIFIFPENGDTQRHATSMTNEMFFTRLAQNFIKTLQVITEEGFVFRVDMRLRPYGDSGPLVMSFLACSSYYQEHGRDWERYALIKGRIISGDPQNASLLLSLLKPFVYRRYIDYGSVEALRNMKQLIMREVHIRSLQSDIKRGPGGIRQIEFIGQVFQLIHGGQDRRLQQRKILSVLRYLKESNILEGNVIDELTKAYIFLRNLENRLQMFADQQTHKLPIDEHEQIRIAYAMNFESWEEFIKILTYHRDIVEKHFERMLAPPQHEEIEIGGYDLVDLKSLWSGTLSKTKAYDILQVLGFTEKEEAYDLLMAFRNSYRYRKLNEHTKKQLDTLVPLMLQHTERIKQPFQTLKRILTLLEAIVRRSAYIILLLENPQTLKRVITLFSSSYWIAEQVSCYPFLLDELLHAATMTEASSEAALEDELRQSLLSIPEQDLEQHMNALRSFKLRQMLRTSAADIVKTLPLMKVSEHLTHTALAILRQAQDIVLKDLIAKYNYLENIKHPFSPAKFAIVAYGKLGGIELSYSSDVDLVFLYDNPPEYEEFTLRLAQRIIHILDTRTANGILYKVDTRLRPSGSAGLLVSHINAFVDYQQNTAWTWEHQALVRARIISGPVDLKEKFDRTREAVLSRKRNLHELREQIVKMRQRMQQANEIKVSGAFDIKQGNGGIADIEFIAQYIVLAHAHAHPALLQWPDNIRIFETAADEKLISNEDARILIDTYHIYRDIIHRSALQNETTLILKETSLKYVEGITALWQKIMMHAQ